MQRLLRQKVNASKINKRDYVYVLQPKADHQRSEVAFTDLRCIDHYIVKKALPNKYLLRKVTTEKTQVLHYMQQQPFTPKEPILDAQTTSKERKRDT